MSCRVDECNMPHHTGESSKGWDVTIGHSNSIGFLSVFFAKNIMNFNGLCQKEGFYSSIFNGIPPPSYVNFEQNIPLSLVFSRKNHRNNIFKQSEKVSMAYDDELR